MRIVAVGDEVTIEALRLMGIAGTAVSEPAEASLALDDALEPETVVLVSGSVAGMLRERVDELKVARREYMVLEIPSGEGGEGQADQTARFVSQAIGIKV